MNSSLQIHLTFREGLDYAFNNIYIVFSLFYNPQRYALKSQFLCPKDKLGLRQIIGLYSVKMEGRHM